METCRTVPDWPLRGFGVLFMSVCDTLADVVTPVLSLSPPLISMYFPSSSPFAHGERGLSALCSFLTIYVGQGRNRLNLPGFLRPKDKMRAERIGIDGGVQIYSPPSLPLSLFVSHPSFLLFYRDLARLDPFVFFTFHSSTPLKYCT